MIEIWSKYNCIFCDKAEKLCQIKGLEYKKYMLGVDYSREDLIKKVKNYNKLVENALSRKGSLILELNTKFKKNKHFGNN